MPRSHLAAAVCASGVPGNIAKMYHIRDSDFDIWQNRSILKLSLRKKTARYI